MEGFHFGAQPWVYPRPVLIIAMYLSGGHKTVKNILKRGAFTVSMGGAEHAAACDYVGIESGNSMPDKVARAGFHVTKSEHVDAPVIDELPLALECKLVSYDEETRLLTGEIVNVSVDERALDENGKLAVEKLYVITFDYANHGYYVLGEKVVSAFEDGKKFKQIRRNRKRRVPYFLRDAALFCRFGQDFDFVCAKPTH